MKKFISFINYYRQFIKKKFKFISRVAAVLVQPKARYRPNTDVDNKLAR